MSEGIERSPERVSITVQASSAHPDVLSIQDAMQQVIDFFDLLMPEENEETKFVWNLKIATTNSPLTVSGEAVSLVPGLNIVPTVRNRKKILSDYLKATLAGRKPARQFTRATRTVIAKRMLVRNTNGIGSTKADFGFAEDLVIITPKLAQVGIRTIDKDVSEFDELLLDRRAREEVGSIEGHLQDIGSDYNKPAILVRERKTKKDIWCRVSKELYDTISSSVGITDVWEKKRVYVKGRLRYDPSGVVIRVLATSIRTVSPRTMLVHDIADRGFTDGLDINEYLDRLREGTLGE